ncbi:MAG: MFS transporter [Gammaproteobacteria bacterium]|nr:MFS transporter [Gammaproteobacteria bacterium]
MSTIVVARKKQQVCIAAETLTSVGDTKLSAKYDAYPDKIQLCGDTYLGIVGSAAHSLVVEDIFKEAEFKYDFSSREGIFQTFVKLHSILKEKYFLVPSSKNQDDDPYETSHIDAVIANHHGIFAVYSLRDSNEFHRFWAVGSGADYALGAMHAIYDSAESAEEVAKAGVMAGVEFDNASSLPITFKTIELKNR